MTTNEMKVIDEDNYEKRRGKKMFLKMMLMEKNSIKIEEREGRWNRL